MHHLNAGKLFIGRGTFYQRVSRRDGYNYYEPLGNLGGFELAIEKDSQLRAPKYVIVVYQDESKELSQPISIQMEFLYCEESSSVHWASKIEGKVENLAFCFIKTNTYSAAKVMQQCVEVYNSCVYGLLTGTEVLNKSDEWYEYMAPTSTRTIVNEDEEKPLFAFNINDASQVTTGQGNICFAHSMQFNRSLVVKKSEKEAKGVELLALPLEDRTGHFSDSIEKISVDGVEPSITGNLMDATERRLMLFGGKQNRIQEIDLERGKIVQEYNPADQSIISMAYSAKTAKNSNGVYTCLAPNVAFNIDTRVDPKSCVILESGKVLADYSLKSAKGLTCHATSTAGHLVTGDCVGNIRLYSGPPGSRKLMGGYFPKTAKTLLDTKTPILALDITADGRYILATCDKFILLINTKYVDDDGKEVNGFTSRMGKHKPTPMRLLPTADQVEEMGGLDNIHFTGAKFDIHEFTKEHCVTASCGNYLLVWSMDAVLAAEQSNQTAPCDMALVGHRAFSINTPQTSTVAYLSKENVGLMPFQKSKRTSRKWTWGMNG